MILVFSDKISYPWVIGTPLPGAVADVTTILADTSNEIDAIIHLFTHDTLTIPLPRDNDRVAWYGCIAQTILSGLVLKEVSDAIGSGSHS